MKCHQRKIREEVTLFDPRPIPKSLHGFEIIQITKEQAEPIILKYEWLGTINRFPVAYYGLFSPFGEIHGVACFGRGNGTNAGKITTSEISRPIALERGACVHYSHPHAPSFLVSGACRAMYRDHGYNTFYAYSDPDAGEVGTIYQACNWFYLGQSPGRTTNYRWGYRHKETGVVESSRNMRSKRAMMKIKTLDLFDQDQWEKVKQMDKHKYVWFEGSKRIKKKLKAGLRYTAMEYQKRGEDNASTTT